MRNIAEMTSSAGDRITVMHWNQKYVIRVERGPMEQVYKLDALDFDGPDALCARLNDAFGTHCSSVFQKMSAELATLSGN